MKVDFFGMNVGVSAWFWTWTYSSCL